MSLTLNQLRRKALQWEVTIDETSETPSSILGFGMRNGSRVVLKVLKPQSDEWLSGEILQAFDGHGTVRVYEHEPGAVLLERLDPGDQLVNLVRQGKDEDAIETFAALLVEMAGRAAPDHSPTVMDWGRGFDRYLNSQGQGVPENLVTEARALYQGLADSQGAVMLLHGDLQHYNVLFDSTRGWVAIDPKGVVGELEYELGPILRNPQPQDFGQSDFAISTGVVERRLNCLARLLSLDYERALAWAFAQAVLSAIWDVEDGFEVRPDHSSLKLAHTLKPLIRPYL